MDSARLVLKLSSSGAPAVMLALTLTLSTSCSSPPVVKPAHTPVDAADEAPRPDSPSKDKVFFSLAPTALSGASGNAAALHPLQQSRAPKAPARATGAASQAETPQSSQRSLNRLASVSDEVLVEALRARWAREWESLAGGFGGPERDASLNRRLEVSRRLIVLAFIRDDHGLNDDCIREALACAATREAADDHRLLAAAYLAHGGDLEAAAGLLPDWSDRTRAGAEPAARVGAPFEVVGLTFARRIEGPGKVQVLDEDITAGKVLLIYGEFRNFTSEVEEDASRAPAYRRSFAASLRLLANDGTEVDRLEFLPESRGRQLAGAPAEVMNFWARYRIPGNLRPGSYRLSVEARDVLGGATASAELPFEVHEAAAAWR